jgi:hypothetical protein
VCYSFVSKVPNQERGFLFIAWGDSYLSEAAFSAKQLRLHNPEPICLVTAEPPPPSVSQFFDIVIIEEMKGDYQDKILIRCTPFLSTIFLDTDVFCCGPLQELFDVLGVFDIAITFTEGGNHYAIPGVPSLFHEPSAGLIAWRQCDAIDDFFDLWGVWYSRIEKQMEFWGAWDQRSLRAALYFSTVRICPIPDRYQFYTYRPNIVEGPVLALHGRNLSESLVQSVNHTSRLRIWIPRVGFCRAPSLASVFELISFALRLMLRALQLSLRRLLASTGVYKYPMEKRPG